MSKETPDYHDADLLLRVYELRREAVTRDSRAAINGKFWPKSYDDVLAVMKPDHPVNAAFRQVITYWEMVYGLVRHGIVNPDYFLEGNGEGLFLLAKMQPYLEAYRKDTAPTAFGNAEWVTKETAKGRSMFEAISARVKKLSEAR